MLTAWIPVSPSRLRKLLTSRAGLMRSSSTAVLHCLCSVEGHYCLPRLQIHLIIFCTAHFKFRFCGYGSSLLHALDFSYIISVKILRSYTLCSLLALSFPSFYPINCLLSAGRVWTSHRLLLDGRFRFHTYQTRGEIGCGVTRRITSAPLQNIWSWYF